MKIVSAEVAMEVLKTGDNIYVHSVAAAPGLLIKAMTERGRQLNGLNVYHLHTEGEAPYAAPEMRDKFHVHALFVGPNMRKAVAEGRASYIPVFLSEMPILFRERVIPLNVALISVSPPDRHGYCTLGPSVDATHAAIEMADVVIAQINQHMPRVQGDGFVHIDRIDFGVEFDELLPEVHPGELSQVERAIGAHVANLIEDGSTLQMGIGNIPNAVLASLGNHKHLGIHTEMFSDGLLPLIESGVVDNSMKHSHPGKTIATFVMGSKELYRFIDNNPGIALLDCQYVNNTAIIRKNPKVVAINSAVEIDITGQVCADSIGNNIYSGVGGQMDFIRGASLSKGGKPIIALPSVTRRGESRIVFMLKPGAGVVTTRAHVHYVATEHGVVNLYGLDLKQRAKALISIAHPDHREQLERQAVDFWK
jgi:4-hydroxybutyrate CoA-transferase